MHLYNIAMYYNDTSFYSFRSFLVHFHAWYTRATSSSEGTKEVKEQMKDTAIILCVALQTRRP